MKTKRFLSNALKVLFLSSFLLQISGFSFAQPSSENISLCAPSEKANSPFFKQMSRLGSNKNALEKAKILYLIDLVRNSPHTFIRNGEEHTGKKAAQHLQWKYGYAKSRISKVSEFIDNIASRSMLTGKDYVMQSENGGIYPMREVLYEELEAVEDKLDQPS